MAVAGTHAKPVRGVDGCFGMPLDAVVRFGGPPLAWREFIYQSWFVARVSLGPAVGLTVPLNVLIPSFSSSC